MADVTYRANLKSSSFPLLSELHGRTIVVRGQDQNYIPGLAAKDAIDSVSGIPQIYYCHNVIPTDTGYKSVGYVDYATTDFSSTANFSSAKVLRDSSGNSGLFTVDAAGNCKVMHTGTSVWNSPLTPPNAATIAGKRFTVAFISGVTYIYFANVGCYTYTFATNTMTAVTLNGLTASAIRGISGSRGYMLAYSEDAIAWSSTTDPTDFVPSLETGAGGGQVEGVRGVIRTVEELYGGLIIFASDNCVAAVYSSNPRYPYDFSTIPGAGGLSNPDYVSSDTGSGTIHAYTDSGLQAITLRSATTVFPEVTDFLSGSLFEDFDEVSEEFTTTTSTGSHVHKKVVLIADRYMIVSYGIEGLTHALYYDTAYKQWGKLKVAHTDCFEFMEYPTDVAELPKRSIAFLTSSGGIKILNSDISYDGADGVMLLGKFQYVRSRTMQMQSAEIDAIETDADFNLYNYYSVDGKTLDTRQEGYLAYNGNKTRKYNFHCTGINHSLLFTGNFNAVSLVLTFNVGGGR